MPSVQKIVRVAAFTVGVIFAVNALGGSVPFVRALVKGA